MNGLFPEKLILLEWRLLTIAVPDEYPTQETLASNLDYTRQIEKRRENFSLQRIVGLRAFLSNSVRRH
jgi:hypothetical protein